MKTPLSSERNADNFHQKSSNLPKFDSIKE